MSLAVFDRLPAAALSPDVLYGTLRVPRRACAAFDCAARYLRHDSVERRLLDRVEHARSGTFQLRIVHDGSDRYDPNSRTIYWDPHSALRVMNDRGLPTGGRQSPALGLGHELDHAQETWRTAARLEAQVDPNYTNAEERRVIRGSERHAARTLHENPRHNHDGALYDVAASTLR